MTIKVGNFGDIEPHLDRDYDYIFLIGVFEYAGSYLEGPTPFLDELERIRAHMKPETGRLVIAIENRLGLKYFAGCAEDHSGRYYENIESYPYPKPPATTFSKPALERLLVQAGLERFQFYYPYPDYKFLSMLYSDRRLPEGAELTENIRNFDRDRLLIFDEGKAYRGIAQDGLYEVFSNSFLVVTGDPLPVIYAKYSGDRAPQYRIKTLLWEEAPNPVAPPGVAPLRTVRKYPLEEAAKPHVLRMADSCRRLSGRYETREEAAGEEVQRLTPVLHVAACETLEDGEGVSFEYREGRTLESLLDARLEAGDAAGFAALLSSYLERVGRNEEYPSADYDCTFQNIIVNNDVWSSIDYEWEVDRAIPARELLYRSFLCYFAERPSRREEVLALLGRERFLSILGVSGEEAKQWASDEDAFQAKVTGSARSLGSLVSLFGTRVIKPGELQTEEERRLHLEELERQRSEAELARIAAEKERAELVQIRIYEDRGRGFTEEDARDADCAYEGEGFAVLSLKVPEEVRALRIDPANCPCICVVSDLSVEGAPERIVRRFMKDNGVHAGAAVLFATHDPWFVWDVDRIRKRAGIRGGMTFALRIQMNGIASSMADALTAAT